jgi:hypothetical protein
MALIHSNETSITNQQTMLRKPHNSEEDRDNNEVQAADLPEQAMWSPAAILTTALHSTGHAHCLCDELCPLCFHEVSQ